MGEGGARELIAETRRNMHGGKTTPGSPRAWIHFDQIFPTKATFGAPTFVLISNPDFQPATSDVYPSLRLATGTKIKLGKR